MEPIAEKNYSKLEWLFFMVIVPVLFITVLTIILLWFLDYDVKGKLLNGLNQIPVIEKVIPDQPISDNPSSNSNTTPTQNVELENKIQELKTTITQKEDQIKQSEKDMTDQSAEIAQLKQQITDLQNKLQKQEDVNENQTQEWANLAKIYANMSPKSAANILSNLEIQEAANILSQMNIESQSSILEKVDPKIAAELSTHLKSN